MEKTTRFFSILSRRRRLCAAGLLLLLAPSPLRAYTDKTTTTPEFLQDGFGPAGGQLPFNGLAYCCPTAIAMSLAYLGINGWNEAGPTNPTVADELNLDRVLSGLMGTTPFDGTASVSNMVVALNIYLRSRGLTGRYTLTTTSSPSLATLSNLNQPGSVVDLIAGYYDSSGVRQGGHAVALLNQGVSASGTLSPQTLTVANPLPGALAPAADQLVNSTQYLDTTATSGNLTGDGALELDPNQYHYLKNTAVIETAITLSINPSQLSANNPTPATWTLSTPQTFTLHDGSLTVLAPLIGAGGINKADGGTLEHTQSNTTTGSNTLALGTWRSDLSSGTPFGFGSIASQAGTLSFTPAAGTGSVTLAAASGSGGTYQFSAGSGLLLDRGSHSSLSVTLGGNTDGATANFARASSSPGSLVITSVSGTANLGTLERLMVNGGTGNLPAVTNGIVSPTIVARDSDTGASGDFLTYGASGFVKAPYVFASSTPLTSASSGTVYEADVAQSLPASTAASAYALKIDAVSVSGGASASLNLGSGSGGQAGLILNGGYLSVASLKLGSSEGLFYASQAGGSISSAISGTGGVTTFGPGTLTLTGANTWSGTTSINSGVLLAANSTGSATGSSAVVVQPGGTLQLNNGTVGTGGSVTLHSGGTLLLKGGSINGTFSAENGSYLFGKGSITGAATLSGTIGSPATDLNSATTYNGVENLTFTNSSVQFSNVAEYDWRLNALDDTAGGAGLNWSVLNFTGAGSGLNIGTQNNSFHLTLDFGAGLPDPNSGDNFWNRSHEWLVLDSVNRFNNIWYSWSFPAFAQGGFTVRLDSVVRDLYIDYVVAVPEPTPAALCAIALITLASRRPRRKSRRHPFIQAGRAAGVGPGSAPQMNFQRGEGGERGLIPGTV